jgi:hypothetical protein
MNKISIEFKLDNAEEVYQENIKHDKGFEKVLWELHEEVFPHYQDKDEIPENMLVQSTEWAHTFDLKAKLITDHKVIAIYEYVGMWGYIPSEH